ncbi:DUF983 domain-containing protein [Euzebya sp.]|uniref:DUF983 domain-containing protein n=1 Tax=Euzebya sp. TaxID=1971409 RepID=UPI00351100BE
MTSGEPSADHRMQQRPRLLRALRMRCPLCGQKPITSGYGELVETCPGCGYDFDQGEEGYYVGALIMNTVAVLLTFVAGFGIGLAVTWPDVPWTALTWILIVAVAVVAIWFYPRSKTLWIWMDLKIHPYSTGERPGR